MVTFRNTVAIQVGLLAMLVGACAPDTGMKPQTAAMTVADESDQTDAAPAAEETAQLLAPPSLVYSWDTGFSSFLSPPIEVRRLAHDDCKADGYEIATVETMALDGSTATATFICRGDFE